VSINVMPNHAPAGDFSGDGSADLLWRQSGGTFTEWQS
jgi:hypothetical protein